MHRRRPRRRHVDRGRVVRSGVKRGMHRRFGPQLERRTRASQVRGCVSRHANLPSPAGLTRGSILFVKDFLRRGWIAGSSPAMTTVIFASAPPRARCVPSPACTELGFTRVRPALIGRSRIYPTSAGGIGRGHATRSREHAKRFICARLPPPHPSPASGGGCRPSSSLARWHHLHLHLHLRLRLHHHPPAREERRERVCRLNGFHFTGITSAAAWRVEMALA